MSPPVMSRVVPEFFPWFEARFGQPLVTDLRMAWCSCAPWETVPPSWKFKNLGRHPFFSGLEFESRYLD